MAQITLTLNDQEKNALVTLAEREFRDPRSQAALIIHKALAEEGLIMPPNPPAPVMPTAEQATPTKSPDPG